MFAFFCISPFIVAFVISLFFPDDESYDKEYSEKKSLGSKYYKK